MVPLTGPEAWPQPETQDIFPEHQETLFTVRETEHWHREVMDLHPWGYSKTIWTESSAACTGWPCFSRGLGQDDLQRFVPAIL